MRSVLRSRQARACTREQSSGREQTEPLRTGRLLQNTEQSLKNNYRASGQRGASARADGEKDFSTQGIFDLLEIQRSFTLITKHFEDSRSAFL